MVCWKVIEIIWTEETGWIVMVAESKWNGDNMNIVNCETSRISGTKKKKDIWNKINELEANSKILETFIWHK